jgi:nitric oxide reductase activation protein
MLVPSLKRLLNVCRRHQKTKQEKLNEHKDGGKVEKTKVDENKSEKEGSNNEKCKEKSSNDDDTTRPPPSKRRRSEDVATSSEAGELSTCPAQGEDGKDPQETGESSKARKVVQGTKTKLSGQLIRKIHSDWVDSLVKISESVMSKAPK